MKLSIFQSNVFLTDWAEAIPFNQGTHLNFLKYFDQGKEIYNEYYGLLLRCTAIFEPAHQETMYSMMVECTPKVLGIPLTSTVL